MELPTPFPHTRLESAVRIEGEDCMGNAESYWRATAWDSTGNCILACDARMEAAEDKARLLLERREHFLTLSVESKLEWISTRCFENQEPGMTISHEEILMYVLRGLLETMRIQKEMIQRSQPLGPRRS